MNFVLRGNLIWILLINTVCYAQTTLRFQPHVDTHATLLGDVLQISHDQQHWSALPLLSHPTAGEFITKEKILEWMQQRLGPVGATWQGKTRILVKQQNQTSGNALLEKARTTLIQQLGSHYTHVNITPLSHVKGSEYPLASFKARVRLSYPTTKRVCVWLTHGNQRIAVWFKVKAYAQVFVAKHHLHYRTPIQSNDFSLQERNIAGLNGEPMVQSLPKQAWLTSSIDGDNILLTDQLKAPPLVIQGQPVNVRVHHHNITVIMEAMALGDGNLGQAITVKNPLNKKTFIAIVSGIQQAEITS